MLYAGTRFRFLLESTGPRPGGAPDYRFAAETGKPATLVVNGEKVALGSASGLVAFETMESLEQQTAGLTFQWSPMAEYLESVVRTNDRLRIEVGREEDAFYVAHDGFVSRSNLAGAASPTGASWSFQLMAEGLQKLFRQAIYNWQGALCIGRKDAVLLRAPMAEYKTLEAKSLTHPPHEVIRSLVGMFLDPEVGMPLQVSGKPLAELLAFGQWESSFDKNWPSMAQIVASTWSGDFWSWIQSMADPALHELFFVFSDEEGASNRLVHRPRPFPGKDSKAWDALYCWKMGKDGIPGATGWNVQRSDDQRANAFHWGYGGFTDGGPEFYSKLDLGWWMDETGRQRYGFAPRRVQTNLIPRKGEGFRDMVQRILEHVALQDAPLHELQEASLQYAVPIPGVRPGEAVEEWSVGLTGYVSSVTHRGQWTPDGFQAGTTLGLSRVLRGVEFTEYAGAVQHLISLKHSDYKTEGQGERAPHEKVLEAARTGQDPEKQKAERSAPASTPVSYQRPVNGPVTSKFGTRIKPAPGASSNHKGVDIGAPAGTPVRSPAVGVVVFAGTKDGYGNCVEVKDRDGSIHTLGHLGSIKVAVGSAVGPLSQLGTVGSTGTSTGPHVHWGVTTAAGKAVNPLGGGR